MLSDREKIVVSLTWFGAAQMNRGNPLEFYKDCEKLFRHFNPAVEYTRESHHYFSNEVAKVMEEIADYIEKQDE